MADDYNFHSLAYVKACEDQRTAARIYDQFVRDDLPLLGEPYRVESLFLAKQIWVHLDWLRENGHDRAYQPKAVSNPVQAGVDRTTSGAIGQP